MIEVRYSGVFSGWLSGLRDTIGRALILKRVDRIALGNFGDHKSVGGGVSELRLAFGPGYRIYYTRRGETVVILLCGGEKGSQSRDIELAKRMAKEIE